MLADSLLPIPFWTKAVNTGYYVQNKVLMTKPRNKTPYELLLGRTPSIGFMRPFGCLVIILNTLDPLGKFDRKVDEGVLVGYSVSSKAFRIFNSRTRIVQETLHINFLENQPNVAGSSPTWLFDIDTLTHSMNYQPVVTGNQPNPNAGIQEILMQNTDVDATFDVMEPESKVHVSLSSSDKIKKHDEKTKREAKGKSHVVLSIGVRDLSDEFEEFSINSPNRVNVASTPVTAIGPHSTNSTNSFSAAGLSNTSVSPTFEIDDEEDVGAEADFSNLETSITISPILTTRVHKDHPLTQIIDDLSSAPQTRSMTRVVKDQGGLTQIIDEDFHTCMFACFLSQEEPKRVHQALKDPSWIEAMQEELLYFNMQKDVKSAFLYGTIKEEVYVCQPPGFKDPDYPDKVTKWSKHCMGYIKLLKLGMTRWPTIFWRMVFKEGRLIRPCSSKSKKGDILLVQVYVDDIIFGSTNKELCKAFEKLMKDKFQMSSMGELNGKSASTLIDTTKPLLKYPNAKDVDVHIYRYLKGKPYLVLWYPKDSPFNLVAYSDSDYAGASLDRKSTTG
nr:hypothetical protein [Tanacetum cinerariifolium]